MTQFQLKWPVWPAFTGTNGEDGSGEVLQNCWALWPWARFLFQAERPWKHLPFRKKENHLWNLCLYIFSTQKMSENCFFPCFFLGDPTCSTIVPVIPLQHIQLWKLMVKSSPHGLEFFWGFDRPRGQVRVLWHDHGWFASGALEGGSSGGEFPFRWNLENPFGHGIGISQRWRRFLGWISPGHKGWCQTLEFHIFLHDCKQKSFFVAQQKNARSCPADAIHIHTDTMYFMTLVQLLGLSGSTLFAKLGGKRVKMLMSRWLRSNEFTDSLGVVMSMKSRWWFPWGGDVNEVTDSQPLLLAELAGRIGSCSLQTVHAERRTHKGTWESQGEGERTSGVFFRGFWWCFYCKIAFKKGKPDFILHFGRISQALLIMFYGLYKWDFLCCGFWGHRWWDDGNSSLSRAST